MAERAVRSELVSWRKSLIHREITGKRRESDISSGAVCAAEAPFGVLTGEFPVLGNREFWNSAFSSKPGVIHFRGERPRYEQSGERINRLDPSSIHLRLDKSMHLCPFLTFKPSLGPSSNIILVPSPGSPSFLALTPVRVVISKQLGERDCSELLRLKKECTDSVVELGGKVVKKAVRKLEIRVRARVVQNRLHPVRAILSRREKIRCLTSKRRKKENLYNAA